MYPILYTSITEGSVPSHYGSGTLSDCLSCTIKEARNGEYELTMEYAAYGIHADEIAPNTVIKAKPNFTDDPQLFRVYKVGKTINGHFTVNAQHISYDLSGKVITTGSAGSAAAACLLLTGAAGNFSITTDKTVSADFKVDVPSSVRSWFGGKSGSILDVYGPGEWKYDNFSAEFMASRGQDRGVTIRYGKNLTELSQTLDMSNLASSVIPYYKDGDGNVTTGTEVPTGLVGITRQLAVDFSSSVDPESATPIATQLATLAASYIANNNLTALKNNITLDFVQIKNLGERVDLCDTVHIYFEPLGITVTAKCVETVWNVLEERYTQTSFGDPRTNIADTIVATQKAIDEKPSTTVMQQAIDQATDLITGNLGGYVVIHDSNGDGEPDEILIMDTPVISTATKVWRWNSGGLGFSPNGYGGPYNAVAIDMQGRIVADAITTGTLNANLIKAGTISDVQGNSTIDMTNGEARMKDFKAIQTFQLIDVNDIVRAVLQFNDLDGASFDIQNASGNVVASMHEDFDAGGFFELNDVNGDTRLLLNNDSHGGMIWLYDENSDPMFTLNVQNGGGEISLYDALHRNIYCRGSNGNITCVSLTQTSSRKVKENIQPMTDYKKILDLDAVSFDFKNKNMGTDRRGFIAEDVAKVLPNLVTPESENMPMSLDYVGMIPYLQAMIKDQEQRIKALEEKLKDK